MTLRSVMLQLREDQIERLDAKAVSVGASRSKLVRDAVDATFATPVNDDVADLYARAYPEPSFGSDHWGDLDAWHEAARRERTNAGRDPW